jgi:leucyl aminopeptidase
VLFLAVGKGSQNEPQFVVMIYQKNGSSLKACWLGGKRITDTGGLNIKTAGMVHMKCDMAGGAAVFGAMQLMLITVPVKSPLLFHVQKMLDAKAFFCKRYNS